MIPPESSVGVLVPSVSLSGDRPRRLRPCMYTGSSGDRPWRLRPYMYTGFSSLGVFAAVPPTTVCSAPPTIPALSSLGVLTMWRPTNVVSPCRPWSRSNETATTAIVNMTNDARNAASKMEPPALGACSVPTLVLIVFLPSAPSFGTCRGDRRSDALPGRCFEAPGGGDLAHGRLGAWSAARGAIEDPSLMRVGVQVFGESMHGLPLSPPVCPKARRRAFNSLR